MAVNKVVFGAVSIMDITDSTVTPEKLAKGEIAYDKTGERITGTMESLDVSDATATESEVLAGETFYANGEKKIGTMPSHDLDNNEVAWRLSSVPPGGGDASMVVDIPEGHYEGGAYPIGTLAMYQPKDITPGTEDITVPGGSWFMNNFKVKGDADLKAENIKEGVEIFGITGTHAGGSGGGAAETCNVYSSGIEMAEMLYYDGTKLCTMSTTDPWSITVQKNSIIAITMSSINDSVMGSGYCETYSYRYAKIIFVYGDCSVDNEGPI